MNERIEKLAEQCGFRSNPDLYDRNQSFDIPKFAELIVRECMNVALVQKEWVDNQTAFDPRDQAWNKARVQQSQHIVDKIKQHFGVK